MNIQKCQIRPIVHIVSDIISITILVTVKVLGKHCSRLNAVTIPLLLRSCSKLITRGTGESGLMLRVEI